MIFAPKLKIYGILEATGGSTVQGQGRNTLCPAAHPRNIYRSRQLHVIEQIYADASKFSMHADMQGCDSSPSLNHCPNAMPVTPNEHLPHSNLPQNSISSSLLSRPVRRYQARLEAGIQGVLAVFKSLSALRGSGAGCVCRVGNRLLAGFVAGMGGTWQNLLVARAHINEAARVVRYSLHRKKRAGSGTRAGASLII